MNAQINIDFNKAMAACTYCKPKVSFDSSKEYVKHLKQHHYAGSSGQFQCPLCFVTFGRINRFEVHLTRCFAKPGKSIANSKKHSGVIRNNIILVNKTVNETITCAAHSTEDEEVFFDTTPAMESNLPTEETLTEVFEKIALEFALSQHSQPNLTRKDVFKTQSFITNNILKKLSEYLSKIASRCTCSIKNEMMEALEAIVSIFDVVKTEHLLNNTLVRKKLLKPAKEFVIAREVGITFENRRALFGINCTTGTLLPLSFQISEFVNRNRRIEEMLSNLEKYSKQSDAIRHYIQGSTWKSMMEKVPFEEDTIYLPLGLYTDGLQYNNALGSHTDSVDNLYYYFPLLEDPFHRNNIHLAASLRSNHIKTYGNGNCFQDLVEGLLDLYNVGFEITVKGKKKTIKFLLGLVIGDNLALNAILEYVVSFSANFYCRICTLPRQEAATECYEVLSKLRTIENYETDLGVNNQTLTGVKGDCVFNQIAYFHSVLNRVLEIMHDFFEGIIKYVICKVLLHFIEDRILTLDEINTCIDNLDYGKEEVQYIPRPLTLKKLQDDNLKMSARECWQFLYLLPICLGHRVPEGNRDWELVLCLIEIVEIILSSTFYDTILDYLGRLVGKFCILYQELFGHLKPKMHFATHLPTAIRAMGPPRHYMCFKMETYHRFFKIYAHVMPNRRNISLSFARKYQYNFAYVLFKNEAYSKISYGKKILSKFEEYIFPGRVFYEELNYKGTEYKKGKYLPLQEDGIDFLYGIKELCVFSDRIFIVGRKIAKCDFNIHLHSFELNRNIDYEINFIPLEKFDSIPINIYKFDDGQEIVRPRNFFDSFEDINMNYNITSF